MLLPLSQIGQLLFHKQPLALSYNKMFFSINQTSLSQEKKHIGIISNTLCIEFNIQCKKTRVSCLDCLN